MIDEKLGTCPLCGLAILRGENYRWVPADSALQHNYASTCARKLKERVKALESAIRRGAAILDHPTIEHERDIEARLVAEAK